MAVQLTKTQASKMLDECIAQFITNEFQRKLREAWTSATEYYDKVRLRQELCLTVQGPIIEKYGYKASPAGVSRSSHQVKTLMEKEALLMAKGTLNNWLVTHVEWDNGMSDHHGQRMDDGLLNLTRGGYKVSVTDLSTDPNVLKGIEKCRSSMVDAHQALYGHEYPGIRQHEWLELLGTETVRKSLEMGVIMLHAESYETGEVVGYISCSVGADEHQYVGSWSGGGDPALSCTITRESDGQLRIEGTFAVGNGSGPLVSHQQWFEAKITSSTDGRRAGAVRLCITGSGRMTVTCRCAGENDWRGEITAFKVGAQGFDGPHAKINHVVVVPHHNGHGVGRLLLEELLQHLARANMEASSDLRLSVVETNHRSMSWYLKLGFVIVSVQLTRLATLKQGHVPMVFLTMQRKWGTPAVPWERFFGREVCGQRAVLLPENSPAGFVSMVHMHVLPLPHVIIRGFDQASGKHVLEEGLGFDATEAFSRGLLVFEKPLHSILSRPVK